MGISLFKYELVERIPLTEFGYSSEELQRYGLDGYGISRYKVIPQLVKAEDIEVCEMKQPPGFDQIFKM